MRWSSWHMEITTAGWFDLQNNIEFLEDPKNHVIEKTIAAKCSRNANASSETTLFSGE